MTNWHKRPTLNVFIVILILFSQFGLSASACTDFSLSAKDGSVVIGRTMEWGLDLKSSITKHPRGEAVQTTTPDGKPGQKWTTKYGYLGVNSQGMDLSLDGMNEKGFSTGFLWLPGSIYQNIAPEDESKAISLMQFGGWLLGNFASVEEAKAAVKDVKVWAPNLADWGGAPTVHVALHDASGKSAVIEFTGGKMNVFNNPAGVLTNAPTFDWQLTNLRNFINLTPFTHEGKAFGTLMLEPTGQGTGLCGMPGDLTPPSRFVHTTAYLHFAKPVEKSKDAVVLAQHIINSVDIPLGVIRTTYSDQTHCDYTQWMVIKDLTNKVFHYRAYSDISMHTINMSELDFSAGAKTTSCPIAGETFFCEVSNYLK